MHWATASQGGEENSLHILMSTSETGEHPRKKWECSTQVWEGEHLEDGQKPVGILDTLPIWQGF